MKLRIAAALAAVVVMTLGGARLAQAQLNGQHIKGSNGLKSGSQAPPGTYVVAPLLYFYQADEIRDRDGTALPVTGDLNASVFGAAISVVTPKKLLGANYGFSAVLPGANNRIQGTEIDQNPGAGITDMLVTPLSLGWHFKRADAIAGYSFFAPTGRYTDGASNNTGLGMWGQELAIGTTVYLNPARQFHAATLATFDFQSKKEASTTKVGNILNLEGGVGADLLKGGLTTGLAYYATFKLSDDQFDTLAAGALVRGRNRVLGLGPEATLALIRHNTVFGMVTLRYQWEVYARSATQGGAWNIQLVLLTKPLKIPA
jgi:hypothetical protein